jgi:riboflavin kinase / FMN adenylyltransferase
VKLYRDPAALPDQVRGGAVAIGNFDGVHHGHARIVEELVAAARRVGGAALVFTFDPHPAWLLRPEQAPPPLTWTNRKAALLTELGVDAVLAYRTDEALLRLSAREFFDQLLVGGLRARGVVEGRNFFFGRDRQGNISVLQDYCAAAGVELTIVDPVLIEGQVVSSSRVRAAISAGEIDAARRMMTRPYRIRGMVTHGAGRGAAIGFPTANLGAIDTLLPGTGVYAGWGHVGHAPWPAAIHVGPSPTFGEAVVKVEVHLIGFTDSLYGEPLEVDFVSRIRDIRPFESVAALQSQLRSDVAAARSTVERLAGPSSQEKNDGD